MIKSFFLGDGVKQFDERVKEEAEKVLSTISDYNKIVDNPPKSGFVKGTLRERLKTMREGWGGVGK